MLSSRPGVSHRQGVADKGKQKTKKWNKEKKTKQKKEKQMMTLMLTGGS